MREFNAGEKFVMNGERVRVTEVCLPSDFVGTEARHMVEVYVDHVYEGVVPQDSNLMEIPWVAFTDEESLTHCMPAEEFNDLID